MRLYLQAMAPFAVPEIVAAVAGAGSVLDAGCGGARLTLALAEAGATEVVGVDTSAERLEQGRERLAAAPRGAHARLIEADFDRRLPFDNGRFAAAVSRLALMIAADPAATLRELRRVTAPGGPVVTAIWAPLADNPWFALPRAAAAAVLGGDRADYARAFGRIGDPAQAADVHRSAGLADVQADTLRQTVELQDAAALWTWMAGENGHVRRLDATLDRAERAAVIRELDQLLSGHRAPDGTLRLARTITLVTAVA